MVTHDDPGPTPRHSVSVAGVIFDEDRSHVLLIKRRDNGHWEPPGGVLELDETIEDGLRREVREETGVDVIVGDLTGVYKNMKQGIVALVFRCTTLSTPRATTREAVAIAWVYLGDLSDFVLLPAYAARILDAAEDGPPQTRHHDGINLLDEVRSLR